MATRYRNEYGAPNLLQDSIQPEVGRNLCRVEGTVSEYGGYKLDILTGTLTQRQKNMLICKSCNGIMREARLSFVDGQVCHCCVRRNSIDDSIQNDIARDIVSEFGCSCPLKERGCKWVGTLEKCENHLDTCDYVYEKCTIGCGVVLQRDDLKIHEKDKCEQRMIPCKHCVQNMKACEMTKHLNNCPKMVIPCDLRCGRSMCRDKMTQHEDNECVERVIKCEFAKYKCEEVFKRKELDKHLKEKETKHLTLRLNAQERQICALKSELDSQSSKIKEQALKLDMQASELNRQAIKQHALEKEGQEQKRKIYVLCSFSKTNDYVWNVVPTWDHAPITSDMYLVDGHQFRFQAKRCDDGAGDISLAISIYFPAASKLSTSLKVKLIMFQGPPQISKQIFSGKIELNHIELMRGYNRELISLKAHGSFQIVIFASIK